MASRWIPLESNPEVLNSWSNKMGLVASENQFCDIYGFDNDLLQVIPKPIKALVLLFPISDASEARKNKDDADIKEKGQASINENVIWIKQTISNACGTIGMLHALINSDVSIAPNSQLQKFIEECKNKTPEERAVILETTPLFASVHAEAASGGQSAVPTNLDTNLHFTCFVKSRGADGDRIIELDGRRNGPVDRGACTDFLPDVARFVKQTYFTDPNALEFSMMALAPPF